MPALFYLLPVLEQFVYMPVTLIICVLSEDGNLIPISMPDTR